MTTEKKTTYTRSPKDLSIPLTAVEMAPFNPPQRVANIETLKTSVAELGQLEPVHVVKRPDGRFVLADGHRRFTTLKTLDRHSIRAFVYETDEGEWEHLLHELYVELNQPKMSLKNAQMVQSRLQGGPAFDGVVLSTANYLQKIFREDEIPMLVKAGVGSYMVSVAKRVTKYVTKGEKQSGPGFDRMVKRVLLWLLRHHKQQECIAYMRNGFSDTRLRNAIEKDYNYVPRMG